MTSIRLGFKEFLGAQPVRLACDDTHHFIDEVRTGDIPPWTKTAKAAPAVVTPPFLFLQFISRVFFTFSQIGVALHATTNFAIIAPIMTPVVGWALPAGSHRRYHCYLDAGRRVGRTGPWLSRKLRAFGEAHRQRTRIGGDGVKVRLN